MPLVPSTSLIRAAHPRSLRLQFVDPRDTRSVSIQKDTDCFHLSAHRWCVLAAASDSRADLSLPQGLGTRFGSIS